MLAERFGLPNDPRMQDWEVEVADFARVAEFLAAYSGPSYSDDDRFALMELIVASLDDGARAGHQLGEHWARTRRLLLGNGRLHAQTLSYWARGNDDDPEHQFAITPLIRWVWREVLADPSALRGSCGDGSGES